MSKKAVKKRKGYNQYKRKYTPIKKRAIVEKAISIDQDDELNITELAGQENIPATTLSYILGNSERFMEYKKAKRQLLEYELLASARQDLKRQDKIRKSASFSQLTYAMGTKYDKVFPQNPTIAQQFNIGDKKVYVTMPDRPSKSDDKG